MIIEMAPGDILGLISDGTYEYENPEGVQFGQAGLASIVDANIEGSMDELVQMIMQAAYDHGGPVPQADDITIVLIRRLE
jgi:serine phosphatase RsbU (regulator of sigma subunit)